VVTDIRIGSRRIGKGNPCFIIAEAGVNHNRDVGLAKKLVDAAAKAEADAVKFQTWVTEKVISPDARMAEYQRTNLGIEQTQFEMAKALELTYDEFREIKDHAAGVSCCFLSTPDEEDSADFLETLGVPAYKIGSGEVTNLPFLEHIARKNRPIILSTGMSNLGEIETAVRTIEKTGNHGLVLLHCVSCYPTEPQDCNLRAMETLASAFHYPVGFSDHTLGITVAIAAASLGACIIEKHLTLDKGLPGPDHKASLAPEEFGAMVRAIRIVENCLGDGIKKPVPAELETKQVVQKSLVLARPIEEGEEIGPADLTLRRAAGGLTFSALPYLVGRRLRNKGAQYSVITPEMLQ
jgi:N,N'-diacetyllegionaminate synthase